MKFSRSRYSTDYEYSVACGPGKLWVSMTRYVLGIGASSVSDSEYKETKSFRSNGHIVPRGTDLRVKTELTLGRNDGGLEPTFRTGHAPDTPSFGFLHSFEYLGERQYSVSLMAEPNLFKEIVQTVLSQSKASIAELGWEIEAIGAHSQEFLCGEIEYLPIVGFELVIEWNSKKGAEGK